MKYVPQESKSTAMGFFQAVYALGMTLFPMICGNIVSHFSMLYAYLFLAVICLLSVISEIISALFISLLPKEKTQPIKKKISSLLKVCTQKNLIVFSLLALFNKGYK